MPSRWVVAILSTLGVVLFPTVASAVIESLPSSTRLFSSSSVETSSENDGSSEEGDVEEDTVIETANTGVKTEAKVIVENDQSKKGMEIHEIEKPGSGEGRDKTMLQVPAQIDAITYASKARAVSEQARQRGSGTQKKKEKSSSSSSSTAQVSSSTIAHPVQATTVQNLRSPTRIADGNGHVEPSVAIRSEIKKNKKKPAPVGRSNAVDTQTTEEWTTVPVRPKRAHSSEESIVSSQSALDTQELKHDNLEISPTSEPVIFAGDSNPLLMNDDDDEDILDFVSAKSTHSDLRRKLDRKGKAHADGQSARYEEDVVSIVVPKEKKKKSKDSSSLPRQDMRSDDVVDKAQDTISVKIDNPILPEETEAMSITVSRLDSVVKSTPHSSSLTHDDSILESDTSVSTPPLSTVPSRPQLSLPTYTIPGAPCLSDVVAFSPSSYSPLLLSDLIVGSSSCAENWTESFLDSFAGQDMISPPTLAASLPIPPIRTISSIPHSIQPPFIPQSFDVGPIYEWFRQNDARLDEIKFAERESDRSSSPLSSTEMENVQEPLSSSDESFDYLFQNVASYSGGEPSQDMISSVLRRICESARSHDPKVVVEIAESFFVENPSYSSARILMRTLGFGVDEPVRAILFGESASSNGFCMDEEIALICWLILRDRKRASRAFESAIVSKPDDFNARLLQWLFLSVTTSTKSAENAYKALDKTLKDDSSEIDSFCLEMATYSLLWKKNLKNVERSLARVKSQQSLCHTLVKGYYLFVSKNNTEEARALWDSWAEQVSDSQISFLDISTSLPLFFKWKLGCPLVQEEVFLTSLPLSLEPDVHVIASFAEFLWEGCALRESAEFILRHNVSLFPESVSLLFLHGKILQEAKQSKDAKKCFKSCLKIDPNHSDCLLRLGMLEEEQGKLESMYVARQYYEQATAVNPRNVEAWRKLADLLLNIQDIVGAQNAISRVRALAPNTLHALVLEADLKLCLDRFDDAEPLYMRAMETFPQSSLPVVSYANFLYRRVEYKLRIDGKLGNDVLDRCIAIEDEDFSAIRSRYEQALALSKDDTETLLAFAMFLQDTGRDLDAAESCFEKAIKGSGHALPVAYFRYAIFLHKAREDLVRSLDMYDKAAQLGDKVNPELSLRRALLHVQRGELEKARFFFEEAADADEKDNKQAHPLYPNALSLFLSKFGQGDEDARIAVQMKKHAIRLSIAMNINIADLRLPILESS